MDAITLLDYLRTRGFSFQVDGDRINVSPSSRLTETDRPLIRQHKAELLAILRQAEPEPEPKRPPFKLEPTEEEWKRIRHFGAATIRTTEGKLIYAGRVRFEGEDVEEGSN